MARLSFLLSAGLALCCRPSTPDRYWSATCVSGDGRHLIAGGDHAALVDTATGTVVESHAGMVKAVGCDGTGGTVVGYGAAFRLPGRAAVAAPEIAGDGVVAATAGGAWISSARTISGGAWRGPASVHVTPPGDRTDLVPALFGPIGSARARPTPDSFAVRFGTVLADGRLLLSAGWQPSRSGGTVERVPWAFYAWDLREHTATPLTRALASTPALNQALVQRIAATPDGSTLVVASHDGKSLTVARFDRDADQPSSIVSLASAGAASALAIAADGTRVAVGSESRGRDAPGQAWLLDAAGAVVWSATFAKTVAGVHFLADGTPLVAAGEGRVVKAPPPQPTRPLAAARTPAPRLVAVTVEKVIDGDTVLARGLPKGTELVRLIGVNAPETGKGRTIRECFGLESARWLSELLPRGSPLRLAFDVGERDRFGRLLAYAYRPDGTLLNATLVSEGYAQTMTIPPNVAHADELRALERTARRQGRGLWGACR